MKYGFSNYTETHNVDVDYMKIAIESARQARHDGEMPIASCLVMPRFHLSEHSSAVGDGTSFGHAEINVLKKAREMGFRSLRNSVMYTTVEPCPMCVMACLEHGVREIVFGAYDRLNGFTSSKIINLSELDVTYRGGVLAEECRNLLPKRLMEHIRETNESI